MTEYPTRVQLTLGSYVQNLMNDGVYSALSLNNDVAYVSVLIDAACDAICLTAEATETAVTEMLLFKYGVGLCVNMEDEGKAMGMFRFHTYKLAEHIRSILSSRGLLVENIFINLQSHNNGVCDIVIDYDETNW